MRKYIRITTVDLDGYTREVYINTKAIFGYGTKNTFTKDGTKIKRTYIKTKGDKKASILESVNYLKGVLNE